MQRYFVCRMPEMERSGVVYQFHFTAICLHCFACFSAVAFIFVANVHESRGNSALYLTTAIHYLIIAILYVIIAIST